jgi:Protein of unknown function (DUF2721)
MSLCKNGKSARNIRPFHRRAANKKDRLWAALGPIIRLNLNFRLDPMLPDTSSVSQLSHVIAQAAAPAFILTALAAFTALLIGRQNRIVDRTIVLNGISDDDAIKRRLKADMPRLLRRAAMMNRAILWAVISSIAITVLVIVAFASALMHIQHEHGVAILFVIALGAFTVSLVEFARELRISLSEFDHHG